MNFKLYEGETNELENYEGSGFGNFLKDQSKKFIKKAASSAVEKAVNTGSTAVGELIANKIIPPKIKNSENNSGQTTEINQNIPIDSGYKIIKLLKRNHPVDNIRKQFISI